MDDRPKIDFAVFGLPIFGGLPICADANIVSPLTTEGVSHPRCTHDADNVFDRAIDEKRDTYHDLVASRHSAFVILAARTGGR